MLYSTVESHIQIKIITTKNINRKFKQQIYFNAIPEILLQNYVFQYKIKSFVWSINHKFTRVEHMLRGRESNH